MFSTTINGYYETPVAVLRRFARPQSPAERCEFCAIPVAPKHRHLLEVAKQRLVCVCNACGLGYQNTIGGRFKLIPRNPRRLAEFQIPDAEWEALAFPINVAFFYHETASDKTVAMYPSPAGAMESLLPLSTWNALTEDAPAVREMESDTEAFLVNRVAGASDYFIVPIDACYALVGLFRAHWRGSSDGETAWDQIGNFFAELRETAAVAEQDSERTCHA